MKRTIRILSAVLAVLMITACSREGFKESLERSKDNSGTEKQGQTAESKLSDKDFVFLLASDEYEDENCLYYYAMPKGSCDEAEASAKKISAQLEELIEVLPEQVADGREFEQFAMYDAITQNNGKIFSVLYEVELTLKDETEESYAFGLVFDPTTGERIELDALKKPDTFITLILDEQLSKIPGKKEDVKAKKREYLSEQGDKNLKKRLAATDSIEDLLDASYFVDGDELVALFAVDQELGGVIEVSVNM